MGSTDVADDVDALGRLRGSPFRCYDTFTEQEKSASVPAPSSPSTTSYSPSIISVVSPSLLVASSESCLLLRQRQAVGVVGVLPGGPSVNAGGGLGDTAITVASVSKRIQALHGPGQVFRTAVRSAELSPGRRCVSGIAHRLLLLLLLVLALLLRVAYKTTRDCGPVVRRLPKRSQTNKNHLAGGPDPALRTEKADP